MARRRDPGEGSVYWNESKSRWEASVSFGSGADRRRVSASSRVSRAAVREKLEALKGTAGIDSSVDPRQPLRDFLRAHYARKAPRIRVTTADAYRPQLLHIEKGLGHLRLCDLTAENVGDFYASLSPALAPGTIQSIRRRLKAALNAAVKAGAIRTNPAREAQGPRLPRIEIHPFDEAESERVLAGAAGSRLETFVALGLLRGLRLGEILGLRWAYVDFERNQIRIEWSLQVIPDGPGKRALALLEVKTDCSRRTISMPTQVRDILLLRRAQQIQEQILSGRRWVGNEHGLVITSRNGRPVPPSDMRKSFSRLQKRLKIEPRRRVHDLRHTCASLMMQDRESPSLVSKLLGHASVAFTMQVYGHLVPGQESEASQRLADRIFARKAV